MVHGMGTSSSNSLKQASSKHNVITEMKLSVLVVDDDPTIRGIHKKLLDKYGIETHVAKNGKEAVDLCHSGMHFDIILMDMEMPIMNGPEATRMLRAMGVNSKILGVTSRSLNLEKQSFLGAGLDECHEKPLTIDTINSFLQEFTIEG